VLYVNVGTATDDEITQAKSHIISGSTVVIDLTQIAGDDARLDWSQKLTGLGPQAELESVKLSLTHALDRFQSEGK